MTVEQQSTLWHSIAARLNWQAPFHTLQDTDFHTANIRWYLGGTLNISANCLDRHLATQADKTAILWESDDGQETRSFTYLQLHHHVCKAANALKALGVQAGDRVTIYLPMIPEAAIAMLACARIGAVHSVVFAGFSAAALKDRILDADSRIVITADEGRRGGKTIPLKATVDAAIEGTKVEKLLVVQHTGTEIAFHRGRDVWWHELLTDASEHCEPEAFDSEHPLFILYTSGSTGKPKGVLHTSGGYLAWAAYTHATVFDLKPEDIYWCTADIGWITGHSYSLYGPLANGATTLMFEGVPSFPDASRFWQVVDKHRVSIFYTAPTAIRALMREGDAWVKRTSRASLRLLGSVGEPINPEAWRWYFEVVGDSRCPIVDTWWQTETGGILIAPSPHHPNPKPGAAMTPLKGIMPVLLDGQGKRIEGEGEGALCIAQSWPGQARTIYGDHDRFQQTYFSTYPGFYFTGDGARRDGDGDFWITGRMDDVLNVSGHRLGTAEIESALVAHEAVTEAAVVGMPHAIKGEAVCAYVTLMPEIADTPELHASLKKAVRDAIGAIAMPDLLIITPELPKTRSGKIMRRILRKLAVGETENLGDTSTLLNPAVVEALLVKLFAIR
jgi:acetyl-CoA synthetase